MTNAILGFGVKLKMGDGADPEVFTDIGEIRGDFTVGQSINLVDATNHQSPTNAAGLPFMEYISGAIDGEEITFGVNYDPDGATHDSTTGIRSKYGQTVNFELHEPGSTNKESFSAIVINIGRSYPIDDIMTMDVTLKPTGDFVESAA